MGGIALSTLPRGGYHHVRPGDCMPSGQELQDAITDNTQTAQGNWTALCMVTRHLVAALRGCIEFCPGDHDQLLRDSRTDIRRRKAHKSVKDPEVANMELSHTNTRRLLQG